MTVTVQQLAHQIRTKGSLPELLLGAVNRAFMQQSVPPRVLYELLWAIEAAKNDDPVTLYLAVLDANIGFDISSIAGWVQHDPKNRIKYFDMNRSDLDADYSLSGKDWFLYAFARWKNEVGNRLVDELLKEKARQNAGQSN